MTKSDIERCETCQRPLLPGQDKTCGCKRPCALRRWVILGRHLLRMEVGA